ncbi:MAG TPA: hypothetical protein VGC30_07330 [Dokdonella sp.]
MSAAAASAPAALLARLDAAVARLDAAGYPFERIDAVPWLAAVECRFGAMLPPSFRQLLERYCFTCFDVGGIEVFANLGGADDTDIGAAPFHDRFLSPWLIRHRFLQFGRPSSGSYDPICFD